MDYKFERIKELRFELRIELKLELKSELKFDCNLSSTLSPISGLNRSVIHVILTQTKIQ